MDPLHQPQAHHGLQEITNVLDDGATGGAPVAGSVVEQGLKRKAPAGEEGLDAAGIQQDQKRQQLHVPAQVQPHAGGPTTLPTNNYSSMPPAAGYGAVSYAPQQGQQQQWGMPAPGGGATAGGPAGNYAASHNAPYGTAPYNNGRGHTGGAGPYQPAAGQAAGGAGAPGSGVNTDYSAPAGGYTNSNSAPNSSMYTSGAPNQYGNSGNGGNIGQWTGANSSGPSAPNMGSTYAGGAATDPAGSNMYGGYGGGGYGGAMGPGPSTAGGPPAPVPAPAASFGPEDGDPDGRPCHCGVLCPPKVSRSANNNGRTFYACTKPREDPTRCRFFEWADAPAGGAGGAGGGYAPADNYGDRTYNAGGGGGAAGGGGGGGGGGTCFTCGQPGHWSRDCPNRGARGGGGGAGGLSGAPGPGYRGPAGGAGGPGAGGAAAGGGGGGTCFSCGEAGHWSRDCPKKGTGSSYSVGGGGGYGAGGARAGGYGAGGGGAWGGSGGGGRGNCYKCGQPGHFSSNCPNSNAL